MLLLIAVVLLAVYLCYFSREYYDEVSSHQAKTNLLKGLYDYVIDVRTQEEWDEGHLEGTISIPIGKFVSELPLRVPDKTSRILFVCKKGIRASGVATMAQKLGYNNIQAMIGNYRELE